MKKLTLTAAFARFGAEPRNARWACSAIARDGSLVISCWRHLLRSYVDGHQSYEDRLSRWDGNHPGRELLREHLQLAIENELRVRQIVATLDDPRDRTDGDASAAPKTFSTHGEVVGRVVSFDGDAFAIDFQPERHCHAELKRV